MYPQAVVLKQPNFYRTIKTETKKTERGQVWTEREREQHIINCIKSIKFISLNSLKEVDYLTSLTFFSLFILVFLNFHFIQNMVCRCICLMHLNTDWKVYYLSPFYLILLQSVALYIHISCVRRSSAAFANFYFI